MHVILLTLAAEAKAMRKTVFQVRYFNSAERNGSKGGLVNASSTRGKSNFGKNLFVLGLE